MKHTKIKLNSKVEMHGHMRLEVRDSKTGELKRVYEQDNKIMASAGYGVNIIMQHFGGNATYSLNLSKAKIGTGTTAPAAADTDLETPATFNVSGSAVDRGNVTINTSNVELEFFLSDADLPNGTYTEFGIFTEDLRIFTRVLINAPTGYTKASNEDATVKYTITITPTT